MATSRPYEERAVGLERVSASQTRSCKQTGAGLPPAVTSAKARNKRKGRSTLASLRSLPSPYGFETASLIATSSPEEKEKSGHRRGLLRRTRKSLNF